MIFVYSYFSAILTSFLCATIYRLKNKISLVNPKYSFCEHCKNTIKWYDNIPIFSFIFLKGRCRYCHTKINIIYFLLELSSFMIVFFTILINF